MQQIGKLKKKLKKRSNRVHIFRVRWYKWFEESAWNYSLIRSPNVRLDTDIMILFGDWKVLQKYAGKRNEV